LKGVAVKVTEVPAQIDVELAAILTESLPVGLTVIVIALEVAVAGIAQPVGVMTQVTTLPLANVEELYVTPVPTTVVPTFHW
jgi:hypothetical protein